MPTFRMLFCLGAGSATTGSGHIRRLMLSCILVGLTFIPMPAHSQVIPSFVATCEDIDTHGYRSGTDINGKRLDPEWSTDEHFGGDTFETFTYKKGDNYVYLLTTDHKARIVQRREKILILVEDWWNTGGSGVWTYVINLEVEEIVAAEITGSDIIGSGVKGRVVQLDCDFTYG